MLDRKDIEVLQEMFARSENAILRENKVPGTLFKCMLPGTWIIQSGTLVWALKTM